MKNKLFIALVAVSLAFASCSDSYWDVKPEGSTTVSEVYATTSQCTDAINGIAYLTVMPISTTYYLGNEPMASMVYGMWAGNDWNMNYTNTNFTNMATQTKNTNNTYTYFGWGCYYQLIYNLNNLLLYVDSASGTQSERNFIKAQALCWRAYCYMKLCQIYCRRWSDKQGECRGVPMRLDLTEPDDLAASTEKEVFEQIYADLDLSLELFQNSNETRAKYYHPDIDVAYAIYARAALIREDWQTAADMARKAYAGHPLMSNTEYHAGFNTVNDEWIWGTFDAESIGWHAYNIHAWISANAYYMCYYPARMSKVLYDQIPATDSRKDLWFDMADSDVAGTDYYTITTSQCGRVYSNSDAWNRYFDTYNSEDYYYSTSYTYVYYYKNVKFVAINNYYGSWPQFRAAEMYLTEAEAEYHLGNTSTAQAAMVALVKTSGRDTSFTCTETGDALLEKIQLYRRIELWGEGHDWFDHKRWGKKIERKTYGEGDFWRATVAKTIEPDECNNWCVVYPYREINYNKLVTAVEDTDD